MPNRDRKQLEQLGKVVSPSVISIAELQKQIHQTAVEKGWWENPRSDGECLMLMVCELSEAMEGYRDGNPHSDKIAQFSQMEEELADVIIRILDFAEHRGFEIEKAIAAKMAYNTTRAYRHGGKVA